MRALAAICIRRPVFATMLVMAFVVVGGSSFMRLGVDRFPSVDLPNVMVRTTLPGGSVEEVESQLSDVLEEVVNRVEGISELRSVSAPGQSMLNVTFNLNRDIDVAAQDVRDRVSSALRRLPDDIEPPMIMKQDSDRDPILSIALSGQLSIRELTEIADKIVKVPLERAPGVGEVQIVGGLERAMSIWVEADRLAAYQLSIAEVRNALQQQNADLPGGNVTTDVNERTLRTVGRFADARQFNDLVVATRNGSPIRVRDIGRAEDGTKEQRSFARLNGVPTVVLEVRRQSGANTVAVIEAAKASLERVTPRLPAGVSVDIVRDQSTHIYASLHEINVHLILGSILACLVVFAFMRDWRATVIAAVAIPTSVISTFGLMAALGFTLNTVTMLALVLMVGIVIDDAIVVLENIFRFIEEKGMAPFEAAREATAEIALPVLATTMSLVVIFIPVSFMSSVSGRFLYQFGFTAACAILISLLVSFTLTPMMSARMFRRGTAHAHDEAASRSGFYAVIDRVYSSALSLALRRRAIVAVIGLAVIATIWPLYRVVRQDFLPSGVDEASFEMSIAAPEGASVAAMDDAMRSIEAELKQIPAIRVVLTTIAGGPFGTTNEAQAFIGIAPHEERVFSLTRLAKGIVTLKPLEAFQGNYSQADVMQQIRGRMRKFPDLRIGVRNLQTFNIGGGNRDIDFAIRGPELDRLAAYAETLREQSQSMGIVDADTTLKLNKPELRAQDRSRARGRPRRAHPGCRGSAQADGRRRPGSDALPRCAGRRGLRRPAAAVGRGSPRSRYHFAPLRVAGERRHGAPRLHRVARRGAKPVPCRSPGPPAPGQRPRRHRSAVMRSRIDSKRSAPPRPNSACRPATRPRSAAVAASWSARSASSAGRSPCRSPSCTWCWRRSTKACSTRSSSCCRCRCRSPSRCSRST